MSFWWVRWHTPVCAVADVKNNLKKIFQIVLIVLIMLLSLVVFLYRDQLQNISRASYLGVFLLCLIANATVLLPAPSLMIAASFALVLNPLAVAALAALGSALGEFVGYIFGTATEAVSPRFQKLIGFLTERIKNRTLLIFVLAALPLPLFDVAGIFSGGTRMNIVRFFIACYLGKLIKMLVYTRMYDILTWASSMTDLI